MTTMLSSTLRRAAHGRHVCYWCRRPIKARSIYRDERLAWDGTCGTFRYHEACNVLAGSAAAEAGLDDGDDWSPEGMTELVASFQDSRGLPIGWPDIDDNEEQR